MKLEENLRTDAVAGLFSNISEYRGQDLTLNAGKVRFLGGLCFQVLLAARRQWAADGCKLDLEAVSKDLAAEMTRFGLSPDEFREGPAS